MRVPPSTSSTSSERAPISGGLLDTAERIERVVLDGDGDGPGAGDEDLPLSTFSKLAAAVATFAALVALTYLLPLSWAQPWRVGEDYVPYWNLIGRELMGQGAEAEADANEAARLAAAAREAAAEILEPVETRVGIEVPGPGASGDPHSYPAYTTHALDPAGAERPLDDPEALAEFYAALTRSDIGYAGAVTRAGHWGDSVLGNDGVSSAIRRRMQARFGDAGHGFHALYRYDASYRHQGIRFRDRSNVPWQSCFIRDRCRRSDARYGYGGATVWSTGGSISEFETARKGPVGRSASVFELWYQRRYRGGSLRIDVDGELARRVDTDLPLSASGEPPEPVDAWARIEVPDGAHSFSVRANADGRVRAYGVVLEREGPGVVWDGMALIGAFTKRLGDLDPAHLSDQLGHRELDLTVFTFGGNDMGREDLQVSLDPFIADYDRVLKLFRGARPEASCLVMGPVDHGERVGGRITSRPIAARISAAQAQVAQANGCAFFDTIAAMGGPGSVGRWKVEGLMSADLSHPSAEGHKLLGAMVYRAIMAGYVEFRRAHEGEAMPVTDPL